MEGKILFRVATLEHGDQEVAFDAETDLILAKEFFAKIEEQGKRVFRVPEGGVGRGELITHADLIEVGGEYAVFGQYAGG